MATILNIETSTKLCSVALYTDGKIWNAERLDTEKYIHQQELHPLIEEVMKKAGKSLSDLDAIAVGTGPGSYTGLRIGVSAAKGLAFSLNKPVIAIPTLKHMAHSFFLQNASVDRVIPMIDARRMEVYHATYTRGGEHTEISSTELDENSMLETKNLAAFIGDGAEKTASVLNLPLVDSISGPGQIQKITYPSAESLANLSIEFFNRQEFADLAYFEPFYYKDFVAGKPKQLFG